MSFVISIFISISISKDTFDIVYTAIHVACINEWKVKILTLRNKGVKRARRRGSYRDSKSFMAMLDLATVIRVNTERKSNAGNPGSPTGKHRVDATHVLDISTRLDSLNFENGSREPRTRNYPPFYTWPCL